MTTITKEFSLIYGHRLWNQACYPQQCRHIHGHSGKVCITIGGRLKDGMIMDFNVLKTFGETLKEILDHKLIMDQNDPLVIEWLQRNSFWSMEECEGFQVVKSHEQGFMAEWYESLVLMDGVPSSENLADMIFEMCKRWLRTRNESCWVESVRWKETESSCAEVR